MNVITKKIAAIALTLALALSVMGGTVATAEEPTIESLLAQIQQLQALIAQLQADDTTPTEPTGLPAACVNMTSFTRNLTVGSRGADVRCLQALLNMDPQTQVAASGVGSKGQETEYFGPLTRNAVIAFQNKHTATILAPIGLSAGTGFVGTQTRVKLDEMLKAPAPAPTPDPDPTDPDPTDPDPTDPDPTDPDEPVTEGDMTIRRLAEPGPAVEISAGQTKYVLGFEVKAEEGRVNVQRVDVFFEEQTQSRLWNVLDYVTLKADGNSLAGMSATRTNFTDVDNDWYRMRFQGFNVPVEKDGTVDFTLEVKVRADYDDGVQNIPVRLGTDAVRGVDAVGIQQFGGSNAISRTFKVTDEGVEVTVSSNVDTPEGVALASQSSTTRHEILRFNVKVENDDFVMEEAKVSIDFEDKSKTAINDLSDLGELFTTVRLYHGTTVLADVDIEDASNVATTTDGVIVTFDDLDYDMSVGTETLIVTLGVRAIDATEHGVKVTAGVDGADVKGEDSEGDDVTGGGSATGEDVGVYVVAPEFTLESGTFAYTTDAKEPAVAVLEFSVKAWGGHVYIADGNVVTSSPNATNTVAVSAGGSTFTSGELDPDGHSVMTKNGLEVYRVAEGTSRKFEVTTAWNPADLLTRNQLEGIAWYAEDEDGNIGSTTFMVAGGSFTEDIRTNRIQ